MSQTYSYSISNDFPGGTVNTEKLASEIAASVIAIALDHIDTVGDVINIVFKAALSAGDKTILDGDALSPAGGLIAAHDSTSSENNEIPVKFSKPQFTWPKPTNIGERSLIFSINWCDKTTWYGDAIRIVDEAVGTGDGIQVVFSLDQQNVIDIRHGKITNEEYLVPTASQGGSTYVPEIKIDGVTKTETPFGGSPADYIIDYTNGTITFTTPPASGATITATYFYSPAGAGSTHYIRSPDTRVLVLVAFEIQFTIDVVMNDAIHTAVYVYDAPPNPPIPRVQYPGTLMKHKRAIDLINWTRGNYPVLPSFGGPTRGLTSDIIQLYFNYLSPIELDPTVGAELHAWLENHQVYGGQYALVTFYGYLKDLE